jgi:NADPH:quinone reductase
MRYASYEKAGEAREVLKLGDGPTPKPTRGEVLVRVRASGVNPSDVKRRKGSQDGHNGALIIPHSDGAGIIEAVGEGVEPSRVGQKVWIWNGQWNRNAGTAADYIALPSEQAVTMPDSLGFHEGASLGVPFLTAWRAVNFRKIIHSGETVLIHGGAGAVGFYAIQLAKRAGFRVITTVSSAQKAALARDAGADAIVNYKSERLDLAVEGFTEGRGVDRVIEVDLARNAPDYHRILRKDGHVVAYGSSDWSAPLPLRAWLFHGVELAIFIVYELEPAVRSEAIAESHRILADTSFKHRIAAVMPLADIVEAHELVESGDAIGNVVIEP